MRHPIRSSLMLSCLVAALALPGGVPASAQGQGHGGGGHSAWSGGGHSGGGHWSGGNHWGGNHWGGDHWGGGWGWPLGLGLGLGIAADPYIWGWPYWSQPYPVYVPPPVVTQTAMPPAALAYWYYCDQPAGYYPYVQSCMTPWRAVPAAPPPVMAAPR